MSQITGRALHYVFKIGNRSKNSFFFRNILGMKVGEQTWRYITFFIIGSYKIIRHTDRQSNERTTSVSFEIILIKKWNWNVINYCNWISFFPPFKVLRHEEFKEGCEAQCNGYVKTVFFFARWQFNFKYWIFVVVDHTIIAGVKQWWVMVQKLLTLYLNWLTIMV